MGKLIWLNEVNGCKERELDYMKRTMSDFHGEDMHLYGVIMGIAYGGSVEELARIWRGKGTVYGFDTFEDLHPRHLAEDGNEREATCMDHWYREDVYGTDMLSYRYQRGVLDSEGLDNAVLVKGEVRKDSCKDIPHIHYAFLDMDLIESMKIGYEAVKDKIVKHGFLLMHDVTSKGNLPRLYDWFYNDVIYKDWDMWEIEAIYPENHLGILRRK